MSTNTEVVDFDDGTRIELVFRPHADGLPRCDKLRDDADEICVLMLYNNRAHDMPCVFRSIDLEQDSPIIITSVHRTGSPLSLAPGAQYVSVNAGIHVHD